MPMDEAARYGDIFVTATGCKDVIVERHFRVMKDNAILCNSGHFDCEVDVRRLGELSVERFPRRENIEGFRLPDGRVLNVLAEGRLVNLAAGNGHPAEIMDMSFAVQALSLEWLAKHAGQPPFPHAVRLSQLSGDFRQHDIADPKYPHVRFPFPRR